MFLDKSSKHDAPAWMIREHMDRHIGRRIRSARERAGLSQVDLGRAVQVSFQQIQKYEAAANAVSASMLFLIALALRADFAYFFDEFQSDDIQR